jgi:uncharacterized protein YecE (DUF72 family)
MIRIGPAGWTYKEWKGVVYPARRPRGFQELSFLAEYFDTIEINTSFYRPVPPRMAASWVGKIQRNERFRFTAKLWRGFTHERNATDLDEERVKEGFAPLVEANRLGALLLQFPQSFLNTTENRDYLARLRTQFAEYPLVLEVRHASWSQPDVLPILERLGVGLCNIDQPTFEDSLLPSALTTSTIGYVRLHGRNYDAWWTAGSHPGSRYDYLYSLEELAGWISRIKTVARTAKETYVIANNTYKGKGIANAFEIASLLAAKPVSVPPSLLAAYPILKDFSVPTEEFSSLPLSAYPSKTH